MNITVFTPTYNRAYIIENLYRSLQRQTYKDFEWLIVDDGSTDETEILINKWKTEGNFFLYDIIKNQMEENVKQLILEWIMLLDVCFLM